MRQQSQATTYGSPKSYLSWLFIATLLLILWQVPFINLAYSQTGTRTFLKTAFQEETLPNNVPWSGHVTANDEIERALLTLEQGDNDFIPLQENPDTSRTSGVVELMTDDLLTAQQSLADRLEVAPNDDVARFFLGESYRRLGNTSATIEQWETAGAQNQLMALARELLEREAETEALEALNALMPLTNDTQPRWLAAQIASKRGDSDQALSLFQEIVSLTPTSEAAYRRVADILIEQGEIEQALAVYQEIITVFPERAVGYRLAGELLFEQGAYEQAIQFFNQSLERGPEEPSLIFEMVGETYSVLGRWSEATDAYNRAIRENPDRYQSYILMGEAQCEIGMPEDARFYFEQALALGSQAGSVRQAVEHITQQGVCPP